MARSKSKKRTVTPEGFLKGVAQAADAKKQNAAGAALSGIRSDTYDAGLRYIGGTAGKKAPFIPDDQYRASLKPSGLNPDDFKLKAKYAERLSYDVTGKEAASMSPRLVEGYKNEALRARDAGDYESARKLAEAAKYFSAARQTWGSGGAPSSSFPKGSGSAPKGGGSYSGSAGKSKPMGKPKAGDGWHDPVEHNPIKRFASMILGNKGVQTTLKSMRMPFSYVASHVSDVAQEIEQGDIGGTIGALGRGVGLGVIGEAADAAKGKGFDIAGVLNSYENEKNRKDFWKQTGVGEYLQRGLDKHHWDDGTILNNKWVKRTIGLGGDIGLDPVTYLTAGATKLAGSSAQVATRLVESGEALGAREAAAVLAKGGTEAEAEIARNAAIQWTKEKAAQITSKGKWTMKSADVARAFPEEAVKGGLAFRAPFTGRPTQALVRGLTGGKVNIEEKLIPLLSKDITNPLQRGLSKPIRALTASGLAEKASGKFAGEFGQEIRGMVRSGDPNQVYTGLGVRRGMNMLRSKAAAGVHVSADTIRELFPEHADKLIKAAGTEAEVGSGLPRIWMKIVAPAIHGNEAEVMKAVEAGTPDAVKGGREVANFYAAAHRALKEAGVPVGEIPDGQYIPRMFTAEGKQALMEAAQDVPKGTTAVDPKAPFMKHRATLEELGVHNQAEARALLETFYGKGTFESDLHKIAANYIRHADQQLGRKAMLDELVGWGIAHPTEGGQSVDEIVKSVLGRTGGRPIPNEPMPFHPDPTDLVSPPPQTVDEIVQKVLGGTEAPSRLKARLRPNVETPIVPEEQAVIDRLREGVAGEPIPASEVVNPRAFEHAKREALSAADLRFQRAKLNGLANAVAWGSIDPELAMKMDLDASKRFLAELGPQADEMSVNTSQYIVQRHLDEGLLRPEDIRTPTRNYAPKYQLNMPRSEFADLMDVSSMGDPLSPPPSGAERFVGTSARVGRHSFDNVDPTRSAWTEAALRPNPSNEDLSRLADAAKAEASQSAVGALTGEAVGNVAGRTYERAVATRLQHMINDVVTKHVDLATGEVNAARAPMDHLLTEIAASPHSEAMYRQLERLGAAERRAIAWEENPSDLLSPREELASMNWDDAKAYDAEGDVSHQTIKLGKKSTPQDLTNIKNPEVIQRNIEKVDNQILDLENALAVASGRERDDLLETITRLRNWRDRADRALWNETGDAAETSVSNSRESSYTAMKMGQTLPPDATWRGQPVGSQEIFGKQTSLARSAYDPSALVGQKNLSDVYLGIERLLSEHAGTELGVGQEQIQMLDQLSPAANTLYQVRAELGGKAFSVPSKEEISAAHAAMGLNPKPLHEIAAGLMGPRSRAFFEDTMSKLNELKQSINGMEHTPEAEQAMREVQRQQSRLWLAAASGKDSEFTRVMLQQAMEGAGGSEWQVSQDSLDALTESIMGGPKDINQVLDEMVAPAHPMGGPVGPWEGPAAPVGRPPADPEVEAYRAQRVWDDKKAALEQRARLIRAEASKRGVLWGKDIDELKSLKQELQALGERPKAAATRAISQQQALEERLMAEYDLLGQQVNEMRSAGRITRLPTGKVQPNDLEAKAVLDRMSAIEAQNPWQAAGKKPDWLMESSDWADAANAGRGVPRDANEAKAPWIARQKEIVAEMNDAKAAGDKQRIAELGRESRKIKKELDQISKEFGAANAARRQVPAQVEDMSSFNDGIKLAEQRIKEGRADETLAHIRNRLQNPKALSPAEKAKLEGGLKRLEEHVATMDAVEKTVAPTVTSRGGTPAGKPSFEQVAAQRAANGEPKPFVIVGTGTRSVVKNPQDMEALVAHLTTKIEEAVAQHGSVKIVSGGAEGFDEALALAARRAGVPYHLDLPTSTHGDYYWAKNSQTGADRSAAFKDLVDGAESVEYTEPRPLPKGKQNFTRNTVMMQRGDEVWALPSGTGGTKHGMAEARRLGMEPKIIEVPKAQSTDLPSRMIRSSKNIWDDHAAGHYAVIPTNTVVKGNGEAVMGAGLAKQARDKFKGLAARYGAFLRDAEANGTTKMMVDHENRLVLVPTKTDWKLPSSLEQVDSALKELSTLDLPLSVPNLGAGNGGLRLADVEAILAKHGVETPKVSTDLPTVSQNGSRFKFSLGDTTEGFDTYDASRLKAGETVTPKNLDNMPIHESVEDYANRKLWQRMRNPITGKAYASKEEYMQALLNQDMHRVSVSGGKPQFIENTPLGAAQRARILGLPEASVADADALADPAPILNGQHDEELVSRLDAQAKDPAAAPKAQRTARDARNWVQNKQRRVIAAVDAAGGDPTMEAAIAVQSQAENAGIERFLRYPTNDPTKTFKQLNKLTTIRNLAKMAEDQGSRIAWLQKSQGIVTDQQVAELLNQVATVSTPEGMRNFLGYYDKFMTYLKAWQLTTPGFHVRNLMGGIFNNYLAGVDVGSTSRFMRAMQKFKAGELEGEEADMMKAIYENVGGGQYSHHEIGVAASVRPSKNPFSPRYGPLRASASFGGDVEFRLRGALMWDRLNKGKSLQEALDDITRYHFDYSNLSNFETGVVKRVIPFYVWTRYNFPLQMEMMAQTPNKYRFYQQFKHSFENTADSGKPVPSFLTNEMFGIPLPLHMGGGQQFLTPDLPMTRTLGQALPDTENWDPKKLGTYPTLLDPYFSQMAVPLKLPAELALSRQFFKGIPIKDTRNTEGYIGTQGPMSPVADFAGGRTKTDYLLEQLMPFYGQARRMVPSEQKNRDRWITNALSYVGVPLRTNTKRDQQNELMRRGFLTK